MMIRSRVWAFRLVLATSTLVAPAAFDQIAPAEAAAKKPTIALGPIQGRKAKDVRGWVRDALKADYEVTDAEDVVPKSGDNAAFAKSGKALATDWVVIGKIGGNKLVLTVRATADGAVADTIEVKGAGARLKKAIAKDLPPALAETVAAEEEEEEEEVEEEAAAAPAAAADDASAEAGAEEDASAEETTDEEPAEEEASTDGAADSAGGSPHPRLVLMAGLEAVRRDFTYKDQISDFAPQAQQYSDYHLPLQPGGFARVELYPAAFFTGGFAGNIGLTFELHEGLTTKSTYVRDGVTQEFENVSRQWAAGVRFRFPFEEAEVGAAFQYGVHKFFLTGDENSPVVPDVKYSFVKIGADATFHFGRARLGARLGARLLNSLGEIETLWFPGATGSAIDAGIFGGYGLGDSIALMAGVDAIRYGFDFNAIPEDNRVAAGGAVDQYFVGWLGVRFQLTGNSAAVTAEASAETTDSTESEESESEDVAEESESEESETEESESEDTADEAE